MDSSVNRLDIIKNRKGDEVLKMYYMSYDVGGTSVKFALLDNMGKFYIRGHFAAPNNSVVLNSFPISVPCTTDAGETKTSIYGTANFAMP